MNYIVIIGLSILTLILLNYMKQLVLFMMNLREQYRAAEQFPGGKDRGHWLFGSLTEFQESGMPKMRKKFRQQAIDGGSRVIVTWRTRLQPLFSFTHPDTAKSLLVTAEPKATRLNGSYIAIADWLGDGLLTSSYRKWERNRRLLTPGFHYNVLKPYFKVYNEASKQCVASIKLSNETSEYVDVPSIATMLTLDVLLQCAFSYKGNIQDQGKSHPYLSAILKLSELMVEKMMSFKGWLPSSIYNLTKSGRQFAEVTSFVHTFSQKIIDTRRCQLSENPNPTEKRHLDFLDILLTAHDPDGHGLTNEEIRDEVDTFLFAGHDTTGSVLTFALYALAKYPEMQKKLRDEVMSVLADRDDVKFDDLPKLAYTGMFIKETMRSYTPVTGVSRDLTAPMEVDGVVIPKNSRVGIAIDLIHHNSDVWDDPMEFRPERFSDDNWIGRNPYMFIPFSAGPRNCIGQNLAMHEEKVILSHLVRNFDISLKPGHEMVESPSLVNRSSTGVPLKFVPIQPDIVKPEP